VGRKKKKGGTPGFVLTYARLALLGVAVLGLLGTFTTLLYNNITKQLDELRKQIEKLDDENDGEREKDRGRFDQVDKRLDQNGKDTDGRFDKLEDRLTRIEMSMVDASASSSQLTKRRKKKKKSRVIQDAYDFHLGMGTEELGDEADYEADYYGSQPMKEARGVGVARVLEEWIFNEKVVQQCEDHSLPSWICQVCRRRSERLCRLAFASDDGPLKKHSEGWFQVMDPDGPPSRREVQQLRRAERRAKRACRRSAAPECQVTALPSGTLEDASNALAWQQNLEAEVRH